MGSKHGFTYAGDEAVFWKDADGNYYLLGTDLTSPTKSVVASWGGIDLPEIEHFLETYPDQHGAKHQGYRYKPRMVTLGIVRAPGGRTALWDDRAYMRQQMNPIRGRGAIEVVIPTDGPAGTYTRQLDCRVASSFNAGSQQQKTTQQQSVILQLQAEYPFFYDPTAQSAMQGLSGATPANLVIFNEGEWLSYPTFTVYPPANYTLIQHGSDELYLQHNVTSASGPVTINCNPVMVDEDGCRVADAYGTNLTGKLTLTSKFFAITPGNRAVRISAPYGGTGRVDASWHNWFLGV